MTSTPSRTPPATRHREQALGRRLSAAVVALHVGLLTLLIALPVAAHPFVRGGGELPVDSLATMTLDLAHGCGSEASGTGQDTLEVALEIPEWLRVVEVVDHPGYPHDVEVTQGRVEVVTWRAEGEPVPAPAFELDVVASGTVGDLRHLAVFQGCADGAYRWVGTPDAPADDPAINVRLVAADPARPAPPPEPIEDPPEEAVAEARADDPDQDEAGGSDAAAPTGSDDVEAGDDGSADQDDPTQSEAVEPAPSSDQGDGLLRVLAWIGAVLAGVGVVVLLILVLPGRRRADP